MGYRPVTCVEKPRSVLRSLIFGVLYRKLGKMELFSKPVFSKYWKPNRNVSSGTWGPSDDAFQNLFQGPGFGSSQLLPGFQEKICLSFEKSMDPLFLPAIVHPARKLKKALHLVPVTNLDPNFALKGESNNNKFWRKHVTLWVIGWSNFSTAFARLSFTNVLQWCVEVRKAVSYL